MFPNHLRQNDTQISSALQSPQGPNGGLNIWIIKLFSGQSRLNSYKRIFFPSLRKMVLSPKKFCITNVTVPLNQNNLKLSIDNYNSTDSNNVGDDNDNTTTTEMY